MWIMNHFIRGFLLVAGALGAVVDDLTCLKRAVESICNCDQHQYSRMYPPLCRLAATTTPTELRSAKRALNDLTLTAITGQHPNISPETLSQYRQVLAMTADPMLSGQGAVALVLRVFKECLWDASQSALLADLAGILREHAVFKCVISVIFDGDYTCLEGRLREPPRDQSVAHVKTLRRTRFRGSEVEPARYHPTVPSHRTLKKALAITLLASALDVYLGIERSIVLLLILWMHHVLYNTMYNCNH